MARHCCCESLAFGNIYICGFAEPPIKPFRPLAVPKDPQDDTAAKVDALFYSSPADLLLDDEVRCEIFWVLLWPQTVTFQYYDPSVGAQSSNIEELIIVCSDFGHHCTFTNPLPLQCLVQWIDAWYLRAA